MKNYYSDYEIEFYIEVIDKTIIDYENKINMLKTLRRDFTDELISRRD